MNKTLKYTIIGTAFVALVAVWSVSQFNLALGSAPSGLPAAYSTATTTQVGPDLNVELFGANGQCSARIVSTQAQPVMLTFFDPSEGNIASTTLSQTVGSVQAASTTAAYDSGLYGCGRVFGYAAASTTITVVETK
jgi:hypothetical protein